MPDPTAVVCIARNEGERLKQCLRSIPSEIRIIYVDSGSTDGSLAFADSLGVRTINLDTTRGFTAARARNAGWMALSVDPQPPEFVQFVDGDCELVPGWLEGARNALRADPTLACVFGRRRERFPDRSLFNKMCDDEWNVPIGEATACGGDAMFRMAALQDAQGYSDGLIAGEEPDLCLRLSRKGWHFRRIEGDMTLHDANILTFGAWWRRSRRAGFAYAEHVWRHRTRSIPQWKKQLVSILAWGMFMPTMIIVSLLISMATSRAGLIMTAGIVVAFMVQIWKIARYKAKAGSDRPFALKYACLIVAGKLAEARGAMQCVFAHVVQRPSKLIEYK